MTEAIVVLVTASSVPEAKKISEKLVQKKLVACANIISPVASIFRWHDDICRESEALLILKTQKDRFEKIVSQVKKMHSYDVPEIIALPIVAGEQEFLNWIHQKTLE